MYSSEDLTNVEYSFIVITPSTYWPDRVLSIVQIDFLFDRLELQNTSTASLQKGKIVVFWPSTRPKLPFQTDAPEGSDIPMAVMRGNRVGVLGWRNGTR